MSKGEFEDRNRQRPGDTFSTSGLYMAGKRKHGLTQVPLGAPDVGFDVRCVFDSRPVLSSDFLVGVYANPVLINANNARYTASFTVPNGYVGILRNVRISIAPLTVGGTYPTDIPQEVTTTGEFTLNNSPIIKPVAAVEGGGGFFPTYGSFFIRNGQDKYDTFLLGDEGNALGINVYMYDTGAPQGFQILANFTGQLLLKSGVAYPYEATNKT